MPTRAAVLLAVSLTRQVQVNYIEYFTNSDSGGSSNTKTVRLLRLLRLFKLLRLARINRIVERYEQEFYALMSSLKLAKVRCLLAGAQSVLPSHTIMMPQHADPTGILACSSPWSSSRLATGSAARGTTLAPWIRSSAAQTASSSRVSLPCVCVCSRSCVVSTLCSQREQTLLRQHNASTAFQNSFCMRVHNHAGFLLCVCFRLGCPDVTDVAHGPAGWVSTHFRTGALSPEPQVNMPA